MRGWHFIAVTCVCVLRAVGPANAQVPADPHLDSLLGALADQHPDTGRVLLLLALADRPMKQTLATPINNRTVHPEFADQALDLSRSLNWARGEALSWLARSIGHEQNGRKDLALQSLDSAMHCSEPLDMLSRGQIRQRMALFLAVNEIDLDRADSLALLAASCFEECAKPPEVAASLEIHARIGIFRKRWVEAVMDYYNAIDYAERHHVHATLAIAYEKIALILGDLGDVERSERFYKRSIHLSDSIGDGFRSFMAKSNWANHLLQRHLPEEALKLYHEATLIAVDAGLSQEELNRVQVGKARCLIALGRMEAARDQLDRVQITTAIPDMRSEQAYQLARGQLELGFQHERKALAHCRAAFNAPERYGSGRLRKLACDCMVKGYRALGDLHAAMEWIDREQQWSDSIRYQEQANTVVRLDVDREYGQLLRADSMRVVQEEHKAELRKQEQKARDASRRDLLIFASVAIVALVAGLWSRLRYISRTKRTIEDQKEISDGLLLNILPEQVARELKAHGRSQARFFDNVTILFSDFKDFTDIAARLSPTELVKELNTCFEAFDDIVARHGIEKIKTIGDAYMAAGGLPAPVADAASRTLLAALEMQTFIRHHAAQRRAKGEPSFDMRIGINTGPVVAGIVGVRKFQYDVWGDTVNTASRMEQCGAVGQVNISATTYAHVKDDPAFTFEHRGPLDVKGKGAMEMYFVRLRTAENEGSAQAARELARQG
jgi:class 3 adenylate cyclase